MELGSRRFWGGGIITKIFSKIQKNVTTTLPYYSCNKDFSGGGVSCVSYDLCVYHFCFCSCFVSPWGIPPLMNDWSLSCDHGLDYANLYENNNNNNNRGHTGYTECLSSAEASWS